MPCNQCLPCNQPFHLQVSNLSYLLLTWHAKTVSTSCQSLPCPLLPIQHILLLTRCSDSIATD